MSITMNEENTSHRFALMVFIVLRTTNSHMKIETNGMLGEYKCDMKRYKNERKNNGKTTQ